MTRLSAKELDYERRIRTHSDPVENPPLKSGISFIDAAKLA